MKEIYHTNILNLKEYLDNVVDKINHIDFIELDPVSIPHRYQLPQDIEIAGLFSSILSWGNRKTIIKNALILMQLMDDSPFDFICNHSASDLKRLINFKHRTFQNTDLLYFIDFLHRHYNQFESLESAFYENKDVEYNQKNALIHFHTYFCSGEYFPYRTKKHIASPALKSTCKRLNMYLRWMVRSDAKNVDFGIWKSIPMSKLMIPLDVHVERHARKFGLLLREKRDWEAVEEITGNLRKLDPCDPVKYDYALFGLGVTDPFDHL